MNEAVQLLIDDLRDFDSGGGSDKVVLDAVRNFEKLVLDLNRNAQLFKAGRNGEGLRITPAYAPETVRIKRKKGQPTNRVTLRDTGDFHGSFIVEYDVDQFTIYAEDPKTRFLVERYGPEILGLDDDSVQTLIQKIRDDVVELAKLQIFR